MASVEDPYAGLEEAAKGAAGCAELVGQTFTVIGYEEKDTEFGPRNLAQIQTEDSDEIQEVWLSGVVLNRQLAHLRDEEKFPIVVTLTRDSKANSPYILTRPGGQPTPEQETPKPKPKGKVEIQTPSTEDQQAFLILTDGLRKKWGAEWVKDVVTNTTKATAPRFLTYRADDADPTILHAKLNFTQISAGVLSILMLELKKADKAADEGGSPALLSEVSFD